MSKRLRIGVIFGGRSGEHEVSVRSARSVIDAIDKSKYEVVPIAITKEGNWLAPAVAAELLPSETQRRISTQSFGDRKSTRLNSSHLVISYAVFCLKKKKKKNNKA